jgi:GxxExxY protein
MNVLSGKIIGAAIEVHRALGPGLLESAYEECLAFELSDLHIAYERQKPLPILYKGRRLDCGYRIDFLIEEVIVLELKAVTCVDPIHKAQLLTYLRLTNLNLGFILNFNVTKMRSGIHRFVHNLCETEQQPVNHLHPFDHK